MAKETPSDEDYSLFEEESLIGSQRMIARPVGSHMQELYRKNGLGEVTNFSRLTAAIARLFEANTPASIHDAAELALGRPIDDSKEPEVVAIISDPNTSGAAKFIKLYEVSSKEHGAVTDKNIFIVNLGENDDLQG